MTKPMFLAAVMLLQSLHATVISRRATIAGGWVANGRCTIQLKVNGAAEVEVSGDMGYLKTLSGKAADWRRFHCNAPLPRHPGGFRFEKTDGRGTVLLLRDPRSNAGTAVFHVNGRDVHTINIRWSSPGGIPMAKAVRICRDSVTDRLNQDGYRFVSFASAAPDNKPGRSDWIIGTVSAKRGPVVTWFSFSCSVDFASGTVRSLDLRRR
jgi:hypothetical protein